MKAAAVYLRVSRDDGTMSVENQRPEVMQMAAGRGYTVAPEHVYVDAESGAKGRAARPALDALLDAAARGKFEAVVIWRLDRLSRDDTAYGGAMMMADLDRFNVATLSHQQTWLDTAGPFRSVLVQFAFAMAADERRTLIERTKRGLDRARRDGRTLGRPRKQTSDALLDAAAEWYRRVGSWRKVVGRLRLDGFANVPSYATIARRVQARTKTGG
jgi:DNA invertase Pin-like site-specific DNA recombinase